VVRVSCICPMRLGGRTAPFAHAGPAPPGMEEGAPPCAGRPCLCVRGCTAPPSPSLMSPGRVQGPAEPCCWKLSRCYCATTYLPTLGRSPEAGRPRQGAPGGRADARAAGPGGRQGPLPPLGQRARARRAAHEHLQRRAGAPRAPRAPAAGGPRTRRGASLRAAALQWAERRQRARK